MGGYFVAVYAVGDDDMTFVYLSVDVIGSDVDHPLARPPAHVSQRV
jgi:hypothetical protein